MVVARGRGGGYQLFNGYRVHFCMFKDFWRWMVGWFCNSMNELSTTELST